MKQISVSLLAGALFGAGLALSGMADPAKVRQFLDVFGAWNPALAFVMAGAMIPMAIAWRVRTRLTAPLAGRRFHLPETRRLDAPLAAGAAMFGIGWGIAGLCPGPAIADLALAPRPALTFVLAMLAGMAAYEWTTRRSVAAKA